jgi:hypothetical protein
MSDTVFKNKIEMRNFAYGGDTRMDEETVKRAVAAFLESQGYKVATAKKREHGADIRATREGLNLIVEAKVEYPRSARYNNNFLISLGQILRRRSMQTAEYGVALPAHAKYVRLIEQLDDLFVRSHLRLNFYLVQKDGSQVGLLKWDVR